MLRAENITQLLQEVRQGNPSSADQLMNAVYTDLRKVARRYMGAERPSHTLQPTAIVNEVFLRLFKPLGDGSQDWRSVSIDWQSRAHFLGVAAKQMRQVLIDHGRSKRSAKRSGVRVSVEDANGVAAEMDYEFAKLNQLLTLLASRDPAASEVVELKFFGGLTDQETALVLGTSVASVRRDWEFARSWLRQRL